MEECESNDQRGNSAKQSLNTGRIKLLISGMPAETTEEEIVNYFSTCGYHTEVSIMPAAKMMSLKGFITVADSKVAETILQGVHVIRGNKIQIRRMLQLHREGEPSSPISSPRTSGSISDTVKDQATNSTDHSVQAKLPGQQIGQALLCAINSSAAPCGTVSEFHHDHHCSQVCQDLDAPSIGPDSSLTLGNEGMFAFSPVIGSSSPPAPGAGMDWLLALVLYMLRDGGGELRAADGPQSLKARLLREAPVAVQAIAAAGGLMRLCEMHPSLFEFVPDAGGGGGAIRLCGYEPAAFLGSCMTETSTFENKRSSGAGSTFVLTSAGEEHAKIVSRVGPGRSASRDTLPTPFRETATHSPRGVQAPASRSSAAVPPHAALSSNSSIGSAPLRRGVANDFPRVTTGSVNNNSKIFQGEKRPSPVFSSTRNVVCTRAVASTPASQPGTATLPQNSAVIEEIRLLRAQNAALRGMVQGRILDSEEQRDSGVAKHTTASTSLEAARLLVRIILASGMGEMLASKATYELYQSCPSAKGEIATCGGLRSFCESHSTLLKFIPDSSNGGILRVCSSTSLGTGPHSQGGHVPKSERVAPEQGDLLPVRVPESPNIQRSDNIPLSSQGQSKVGGKYASVLGFVRAELLRVLAEHGGSALPAPRAPLTVYSAVPGGKEAVSEVGGLRSFCSLYREDFEFFEDSSGRCWVRLRRMPTSCAVDSKPNASPRQGTSSSSVVGCTSGCGRWADVEEDDVLEEQKPKQRKPEQIGGARGVEVEEYVSWLLKTIWRQENRRIAAPLATANLYREFPKARDTVAALGGLRRFCMANSDRLEFTADPCNRFWVRALVPPPDLAAPGQQTRNMAAGTEEPFGTGHEALSSDDLCFVAQESRMTEIQKSQIVSDGPNEDSLETLKRNVVAGTEEPFETGHEAAAANDVCFVAQGSGSTEIQQSQRESDDDYLDELLILLGKSPGSKDNSHVAQDVSVACPQDLSEPGFASMCKQPTAENKNEGGYNASFDELQSDSDGTQGHHQASQEAPNISCTHPTTPENHVVCDLATPADLNFSHGQQLSCKQQSTEAVCTYIETRDAETRDDGHVSSGGFEESAESAIVSSESTSQIQNIEVATKHNRRETLDDNLAKLQDCSEDESSGSVSAAPQSPISETPTVGMTSNSHDSRGCSRSVGPQRPDPAALSLARPSEAGRAEATARLEEILRRAGGELPSSDAVRRLCLELPAARDVIAAAGSFRRFCSLHSPLEVLPVAGGKNSFWWTLRLRPAAASEESAPPDPLSLEAGSGALVMARPSEAGGRAEVTARLEEILRRAGGELPSSDAVRRLFTELPAARDAVAAAGSFRRFCSSHSPLEVLPVADGKNPFWWTLRLRPAASEESAPPDPLSLEAFPGLSPGSQAAASSTAAALIQSSRSTLDLSWAGHRSHEDLGDAEACEVCFERAFDTRLLPCRHQLCAVCAGRIRHRAVHQAQQGATCPFCRATIQRLETMGHSPAPIPAQALTWCAPRPASASTPPSGDQTPSDFPQLPS